ncbi:MAG: sulfite exporter TauE/SafE family protein [Rhizobiales bacterium]|nr:sulfite exporter TauE/SafE family protein [Hyphomicrobiales bacterium]
MTQLALDWHMLAVIWTGAFIGGIATGAAGFAFAVVAASIWLHVLDPLHTTALIVSLGIIVQGGLTWTMRRAIEPTRLWPFVVGCAAGVPCGVYLLWTISVSVLTASLGVFMVVYGLYAVLAPRLPYITVGRWADGVIGFIGGLMGGIGGYSGVVPTMWTQLRGWSKDVARGVYQPFILIAHVATIILVGFVALDIKALILTVVTLPVVLAGVWVGLRIYGRLDELRFRQMLGLLLIISGAALVV